MKKHLIIGLLVVITLISIMSLLVAGQGGFSSWRSINMTGVSNSYLILDRQGVLSSHFVIETSYTWVYAPTNLVLTMVGDNEVLISWTMGAGACNSMVRGAVGRVPTSRTDGYLVYYGSATSATDWIDEDEMVYYRVWSQSCDDSWETTGIYDSIGGNMVPLVLFGILGLGLTFGFFWKKSGFFAYGAAGAWALLGFQAFTMSATATPVPITDTYMALFWLCVAFTISCVLLPTVMREKPSPDDIYVDEVDEVTGEKIPKEGPKPKRKKTSRFARLGR